MVAIADACWGRRSLALYWQSVLVPVLLSVLIARSTFLTPSTVNVKFRDWQLGSLPDAGEVIVAVSCEDRLELLNHNLGFFLAGIDKLSHLFQGRLSNAVLTSRFDISPEWFRIALIKVSKVAKIRNRYNQVPHLTKDTNGKVTNSQKTPQTRAKRSALSQQVTTKHI